MARRIGLFLVPPAFDAELDALAKRSFEALMSGDDDPAIESALFERLASVAVADRVVTGRSDSISSLVELVKRAAKKRWDDLSGRERREASAAALATLTAAKRTPFFAAVAEFLRVPVDAAAGLWLEAEPQPRRPIRARLGMYLAPVGTAPADLASRATAARHLEVDGARAMWESFTERVEDATGMTIDALSPVELRGAIATALPAIKKSRRGPVEDLLAELLAESNKTDGLWVVEEEPLPESEPEDISPEEAMRRLDAFVEENRAKKRRLGARAETEVVLRMIEAPAESIAMARERAGAVGIEWKLEAINAALGDDVIASEDESQVIGDRESIRHLLDVLPESVRTTDDLYAPTEARALLSAIDALDRPTAVAKEPHARFLVVLRRAVKNGNGFAVFEKVP